MASSELDRVTSTLARAAKDYRALWDSSDPNYGKPHLIRSAYRYFVIVLGSKRPQPTGKLAKDVVMRKYAAEKTAEGNACKKITIKRSATQTTI
ncbi:hypothetical protein AAVH_33161 [Aphelenchoides avenae]|nr:hypothetical protein AAVH_33161 [Aphelenchus avenae]